MINDLLLLSDLHLTMVKPISRIDDVQEEQDRMLRYIAKYALDNGISMVLQAGDFCDQKRSWELLQYLSLMMSNWKSRGLCLYTVMGQHDSYYHDMTNMKTVMGVLYASNLVTRLRATPIKRGTIHIYGASYGDKIPDPWETKGAYNILVIHAPVLWKKVWKQQEGITYAPDFLDEHPSYDLVLCGDQHQRFIFKNDYERVILNTGPMMRLSADERDHEPGFYHFSIKQGRAKWVPLPYEQNCWSVQHLEHKAHQEAMFEKFTSRLASGGGAPSVSFDQSLREYFKKHKTKSSVQKIISERVASAEG